MSEPAHATVPQHEDQLPRIILIRHGQTTANTQQILDTQLPGAPLTDLGVTQSRFLGRTLVPYSEQLTEVVTSYALRARQTGAGAVAGLHRIVGPGVRLRHMEGLHEVQAGDLEGRSDFDAHRRYLEIFHTWMTGDLERKLPGGESGLDVLGRYLPTLSELLHDAASSEQPRDVAIVSHGAAIRLVAQFLSGADADFVVRNRIGNTERIELVAGGINSVTDDGSELNCAPGTWSLSRWGSNETCDDVMG